MSEYADFSDLIPRPQPKPKHMSIDIETRSGADIGACGAYRYAQDPEFKILLFAYRFDDGPVYVLDLTKHGRLPGKIAALLQDPEVTKHAYNAAFEWYCLMRAGYPTDISEWRCTMFHAMYCALPAGLAATGEAIGLPQDKKKLTTGRALIRYFCTPQKPTKRSDKRYHDPEDDPDKWQLFKEYCKQDVVAESEILQRLRAYPVPELEEQRWQRDIRRNAYGIRVDVQLVQGALAIDADSTAELNARAKELTGLDNPNSLAQLKAWIQERTGRQVDALTKAEIPKIIEADVPEDVREVLRIRQMLGKTSVKKYTAMMSALGEGDRIRGLLQFYGAVRTGRFAGRLVQVQNLPRNYLSTLDLARRITKTGDVRALRMIYKNVPDTLSQLIRTAFIPADGCKFIVTDFSAIEARVIAWLAGEEWVNEVFATHGKIYEMTASQMFGVPVERIVKGSPEYDLRQKGKVATLACIAEGSPVLTDCGLVPIEKVTEDMRVWDGVEWVAHAGVVCNGVKEVITYEGLTATEDHIVWIEGQPEPVRFGDAAASGAHLVQTGAGRRPVRLGGDYKPGEAMGREVKQMLRANEVHRLRSGTVDVSREFNTGKVERLSKLLPAETAPAVAGPAFDCSKAEMHESERPAIRKLRSARDTIRVQLRDGGGSVYDQEARDPGPEDGDRQDRQQRRLRSGEPAMVNAEGKCGEQTDHGAQRVRSAVLAVRGVNDAAEAGARLDEIRDHPGRGDRCVREEEVLASDRSTARVYDIRFAGPRNRYTVSNALVHNCGYGGGPAALIAMGALDMGLTEEELPDIVSRWRKANTRIVKLWRDVEQAAVDAVMYGRPQQTHGLVFRMESDMVYGSRFLSVQLPSGRRIFYPSPSLVENRFGKLAVHYLSVGDNHKWTLTGTYGGKLVENIVQAIARDCLMTAMDRMEERGWRIVMHVHDEVVIEAPPKLTLEDANAVMGEPIPWAPGLILKGAGFEGAYYMKD